MATDEDERGEAWALDVLIFETLGLREKDVNELYREASEYVTRKKNKTDSVSTKKSKGKLSNEDALELIKERFSEIESYASLIEGINTRTVTIPEWEAKYLKGTGADNLFGLHDVYFKQGNKQIKLSFTSPEQLQLFRLLNQTFEIRGQKIKLPESPNQCKEIYRTLKEDFDANFPLIKSQLKSHRSKANPISIYRTVVVE